VLALPLRRVPRPLVLEAEGATGEPPFDRATKRRPITPAVGVASAATIARVVDAGDKRAADVAILVRVSHRWRMGHLPPGTARPRLQNRQNETVGRHAAVALYVLTLVAVVVGVDVLFFRHHFWERLIANVGIVLVFAAFALRFRHASGGK
jgi:hypothetical protein